MRRREARSPNSVYIRYRQEQFRKTHLSRGRIGVRIHRLAKKLHFGISQIRELPHLSQYAIAGAAALIPTRKRHHAARERVVAAFDDGHDAPPAIVPMGAAYLLRDALLLVRYRCDA